jgi:hypothetical protein
LPSYYDEKEGRRKQVPDPMFDHRGSTYAQYIERVNKGEILARDVHDPMHAVHVVMWALAGLQLHIKHGIPCPGINTLFLALAAGSHDRARRADGVDFWDGESAQAFKSLMRALGYDVKEIEAYVHAIREKDPKGKIFTSKIQELIHDADCWDIIRCLKDFSEFDKNELCVYRNGQIPKEVLDQMTEEIRTFIKITSDFSLRQRLQSTSTNYFRDVLLILAAHKKECPLLNELLDYEIRMS